MTIILAHGRTPYFQEISTWQHMYVTKSTIVKETRNSLPKIYNVNICTKSYQRNYSEAKNLMTVSQEAPDETPAAE